MRTSGVVEQSTEMGAHDHLCWAYDDPDELIAAARAFLADGLEQGQRVGYIGGLGLEVMEAELLRLGAGRPGAVFTTDLATTYTPAEVVAPAAQVDTYARATAEAVAAGFTGLRVAADATALVRTSAQRDAFARYEQLIDRRMATMPFAAICAYDRRELGADAVAELACMHPATNDHTASFGVFAREGVSFAVRGEVDAAEQARFARAVARVPIHEHDGQPVVDLGEVGFLDHRALSTLAEHARAAGRPALLVDPSPTAARLVGLLALGDVLQLEGRP